MAGNHNYVDRLHKIEQENLSEFAVKAKDTKGRLKPQAEDICRTDFQRDRDRIIHCKAFRRLMHKTQVFLAPKGDHYRTRLTHTLEVNQIARSISRSLRLNEDLTEAIALGHDLGHTPFGHAGEFALQSVTDFTHSRQSLRVVDCVENEGKGLNLTHEVRNGILNHTSKGNPETLEGHIVSWSDRIAYLNHDIDDAIRAGLLKQTDIPKIYTEAFGGTGSERINSMIMDIIDNCTGKNYARPSDEYVKLIGGLRQFMFDTVYNHKLAKKEEVKIKQLIVYLYDYYTKHIDKLPKYIKELDATKEQKVCDYISTMTDNYASSLYTELVIPRNWEQL